MKKKLDVRICSGTACYVQGGSYLFDIADSLTGEEEEQISLTGESCLGLCSRQDEGKPPYAVVGEKVIAGATVDTLIAEIRSQLKGGTT